MNNLNAITEQEVFEAVYKFNFQRYSKEERRWIREHTVPDQIYNGVDGYGKDSQIFLFKFTESPSDNLSLPMTKQRLLDAYCEEKDPDEKSIGIQDILEIKRMIREEGRDMARNKVVTVRMTEEEKDRLEALAARFGLSVTSMIVMLTNKEYYEQFEKNKEE